MQYKGKERRKTKADPFSEVILEINGCGIGDEKRKGEMNEEVEALISMSIIDSLSIRGSFTTI